MLKAKLDVHTQSLPTVPIMRAAYLHWQGKQRPLGEARKMEKAGEMETATAVPKLFFATLTCLLLKC